jgi:hypothetical protein
MDYELLLQLMSEQPAIQNLEFLRQLIAETRGDVPSADMAKLRMYQGNGMGTDNLSVQQGDR